MKTTHILPLILALSSLTACVGPLVVHETARTVGKANHELDLGFGSRF